MLPVDDEKNKDAEKSAKEDQAPAITSGGKARKRTWSKGNVWDKLRNRVVCDKATYDQLCEEVPNYKRITPAAVSERRKTHSSSPAPFRSPLVQGLLN